MSEAMVSAPGDADSRFAFGENWVSFLRVLDEERITEAMKSLCSMLEMDSLAGRTFLDVGSGSGLFSLAAMRLGAARVFSFDYDWSSVGCAQELRARYYPGSDRWTIERGDVLSREYLAKVGQWDVVYSWGVLHHTGNMWAALENVAPLVVPGGVLFIALYNDAGRKTEIWRAIKRFYNQGPVPRALVTIGAYLYFGGPALARDLVRRRDPRARYRQYAKRRGMSAPHDWIDWVGGYPYEVARPDAVFNFYRARGFRLERLLSATGCDNNQFVFRKVFQEQ